MYARIIGGGGVPGLSISDILQGPGDPARVDQAVACVPVALTLYLSLHFIHNHLKDLSAPDGSALVCPCHSQQTESFTELSQASQYLNQLKFK